MAVAVGDQRRKKEAMDLLVAEISRGEEENIANCLRVAVEVRLRLPVSVRFFHHAYIFTLMFPSREDGCRILWTA